jgi:hypothetical protein
MTELYISLRKPKDLDKSKLNKITESTICILSAASRANAANLVLDSILILYDSDLTESPIEVQYDMESFDTFYHNGPKELDKYLNGDIEIIPPTVYSGTAVAMEYNRYLGSVRIPKDLTHLDFWGTDLKFIGVITPEYEYCLECRLSSKNPREVVIKIYSNEDQDVTTNPHVYEYLLRDL